jgi:hypothetical protein
MIVQKVEALHHPRVETVTRVSSDLTRHVNAIAQPGELRARRRRKNGDLAILALISVLHPRSTSRSRCKKASAFAEAFLFARSEIAYVDFRV